jgi:phage/plasmid primase-like uncharacterized protein
LLIADDLVSAIELNRLTQKPVVWAVKTENLKAVVENIRRLNPKRQIVIAVTDAYMAKENQPMELAKEAAEAVLGTLVIPPLSENDRKRNMMSFGDLLKTGNNDAVKRTMKTAGIEKKTSLKNRLHNSNK